MYSENAFATVALQFEMGLPKKTIARVAPVSHKSVKRWIEQGPPVGKYRGGGTHRQPVLTHKTEGAYAYLLGLYLGDGHISRQPRNSFQLRISLDSRYPGIVAAAASSIRKVMPRNRTSVAKRQGANLMLVSCSSTWWPILFPQIGPGRKHTRPIWLASWQEAIADRHPRALIRGLIHSDGCRFIANQRVGGKAYRYPRYGFSNRSNDIMRIFCDYLDLLEVDWSLSSPHQAQIARRASVAALDQFVGPKR